MLQQNNSVEVCVLIRLDMMYMLLGLLFGIAQAATISLPNGNVTMPVDKKLVSFSIEPISFANYSTNNMTHNLMAELGRVQGAQPAIRIGGTTSDESYYNYVPQGWTLNTTTPERFTIDDRFYQRLANYFPNGTEIIYTLNLADNSSDFANAVQEAIAVKATLGDKLKLFELGNEIDHYISEGWRAPGWDTYKYVPQFRNLSTQINQAIAQPQEFGYQGGVIADPPWVLDQQAEVDDFDIINCTKHGLVGKDIKSYSMHLYPQSTCDPGRASRLSLSLLSNHSVLLTNLSQYYPQVQAAHNAGAPFVMGETNSASCGGRAGISDTLVAALWGVDYALTAASMGMQRIYFHLGAQSEYSAWIPEKTFYNGHNLTAGVRANFYTSAFIAQVLKGDNLSVAGVPQANTSTLSGFALYNQHELSKLVFLNMQVYNSSIGLLNPSTLPNSTIPTNSSRPVETLSFKVPWDKSASVIRLQGPGSSSKSEVNVSGLSFDESGQIATQLKPETVNVIDGMITIELQAAEAVLVEKLLAH